MSENVNSELQAVLTKLVQAKATAEMSLDGWDPRTKPGAAVAKREAADTYANLKDDYQNLVTSRIAKVFVFGNKERVEAMGSYLDEQGAIVVNGQALYSLLANPVEQVVDPRARRFDSQQFLRLRQEYLDTAQLLNLESVPDLTTVQSDYDSLVLTPFDTLAVSKKIIRRAVGDSMNALFLQKKIFSELLNAEVVNNWIPVVITGCPENEVSTLSSSLFPSQPVLAYKADDVADFEVARNELSKKIVKLLNKKESAK